MSREEPPTYAPIVDNAGKVALPWDLFFTALFEGDLGDTWLPNFINLGVSGTPTISGRYYQISSEIAVFWVDIQPSTNTSSIAGTTYIDNFPLTPSADGFCVAVSGGQGTNAGMIDASTNRIYTPAWSSVSIPITVIGFAFAR